MRPEGSGNQQPFFKNELPQAEHTVNSTHRQIQPITSSKFDDDNKLVLYLDQQEGEFVEEWMLLANQCAAAQIAKVFPDCSLLIRNNPPDPIRLSAAASCFKMDGFGELDSSSRETMARSYEAIVSAARDRGKDFDSLVRLQLVKCLGSSEYFVSSDSAREEWEHWSLGFPAFTYFTSPIRRYPDIIVHRLLDDSLKAEKNPDMKPQYNVEELRVLANAANEMTKVKNNCSSAYDRICQMLYFYSNPTILSAIVSSIDENEYGPLINVFIPGHEILDRLHVPIIFTTSITKDPSGVADTYATIALDSEGNKQDIHVFDTIRVKVSTDPISLRLVVSFQFS